MLVFFLAAGAVEMFISSFMKFYEYITPKD